MPMRNASNEYLLKQIRDEMNIAITQLDCVIAQIENNYSEYNQINLESAKAGISLCKLTLDMFLDSVNSESHI